MINRYFFSCGKDSCFNSSGLCIECSRRKELELYNKEKHIFNNLSLELKIDYLFDKLYDLNKKKSIMETYY